jgi:cysteine-rich secretory family protein
VNFMDLKFKSSAAKSNSHAQAGTQFRFFGEEERAQDMREFVSAKPRGMRSRPAFLRNQRIGFLIAAGVTLIGVERVNAQAQYSIGSPTIYQQYMLELINRARANGGAEAARLGLSGLQEGPPKVNNEPWTIENSVQPLSWNPKLTTAAQGQSNRLNNADQFFLGGSPHTFGGTTPMQRIAATGYSSAPYNGPTTPMGFFPGNENVSEEVSQGSGPYSGAKLIAAVLSAHNGLFKDLSVPGRGHRETIMLGFFREVGIGITAGTDNQANPGQPNGTFNSLYIVQDYGTQSNQQPFITGVVFHDTNGNNFYDPGEGIGGVRVDVQGSSFYAVTSSSGGYSVPVAGNGSYNVTFSGGGVATLHRTATVTANRNIKLDYRAGVPNLPPGLENISTRARVETGDNVLIAGFIIGGSQPKTIIVRGLGPSLPLAGRLANPGLELHNSSGALIESNDNWQQSPGMQAVINNNLAPTNALESAIARTLTPGGYTAILRGINNGVGIGLVEVYDVAPSATSQLGNLSSRGRVQTGDNVMIAGVIVRGQSVQEFLVRVLGPSVAINGRLVNPTLELRDRNGALLATNDNWKTSQRAAIQATGLAPPNDLEPAILRTLMPAPYTAIVRGVNNSSGIALVEIYPR